MNSLGEEKHIGMMFRDIQKGIVALLNKDLEAYGITLMQNEILFYIYFHEKKQNINQKDIEKYFNSTNPTITGILNRLQSKGLILREASMGDARYKVIKLTDAGRLLVDECLKTKTNKMEHRLVKKLSLEEKQQLRYLLNKVMEGLEEERLKDIL